MAKSNSTLNIGIDTTALDAALDRLTENMDGFVKAVLTIPCPQCGVTPNSDGNRWHLSSCVHYEGPR
jgi:hypothetical protein